jgi:transcriptional regulator with XRE-family HTH domain
MLYDFSILRSLRKRSDLTIADVSDKSGVSPAVISKLERNQTSAELETLFRIARVFEMSAADLIALAEARTGHRKEASHREIHGFSFEQVKYANVLCLYGTANTGEELSRPEIHEDDYEVCWVLDGEVEIKLPGETHNLKAGQSLQFDAILEHAYRVVTDCRLMILHITKSRRF